MKKILSLICLVIVLSHFNLLAQKISAAEYFFDKDPGVGKATAITISTASDSVDISGSAPTTGLSAGFHVMGIRVKNVNKQWSLYATRQFYLDVPPSGTIPTITAAEYFFDTDPGIGKASAIAVPSPGDSIDVNNSVTTSGLAAGFHVLAIRVKNSSGIWGLYASRTFYLDVLPSNVLPNITAAEYFFDNDPGVGNGTAVTVPAPGDSIDINSSVSTAGLSLGFHRLAVRVKNGNGIWGLYASRVLYIDDTLPSASNLKIVTAEMFFDTDPGLGKGSVITPSFSSADSIDVNTSVSAVGLAQGNHYLFVRVQNEAGKWSQELGEPFSVCSTTAPVAQFTDSIIGNTMKFFNSSTSDTAQVWDFGDGDTSHAVNPTHNYTTQGFHTIKLIVYNPCTTDTTTLLVNIGAVGINSVTSNYGANVFPNPNDGNFTLAWHLAVPTSELQLTDIAGRVIYAEAISKPDGTETINVPALSSGIYYWRIVAQDKVIGKSMISVVK